MTRRLPVAPTRKTACCINLGCSENHLDGSLISGHLKTNDWALVDNPRDADLIIVNSCGFTRGMEEESLGAYRAVMSAKRPGARVVFAGCLPAINRRAVRDAGYDGPLVTPRTLHHLDAVIEARVSIDDVRSGCVPASADGIGLSFGYSSRPPLKQILNVTKSVAGFLRAIPGFPIPRWLWQVLYLPDDRTELVRISVGCMNHCGFCAIPRAKGVTKSVPPEIILERVQDAVRRGRTHIALSCDELASYGQDIGTDIVSLLDRLTARPGDFHLILRNVHPEWMIRYWKGLKPVFERGKVSYLVLPLQSGSDRVLELMKRNHTGGEYATLIEEIRRVSPGTIIRTHVLVGFPGETDEDFEATCRFVRRLPVDSYCVHEYSEQAFLPSARDPGKVPEPVIRKRAARLRRLEWSGLLSSSRWLPLRP